MEEVYPFNNSSSHQNPKPTVDHLQQHYQVSPHNHRDFGHGFLHQHHQDCPCNYGYGASYNASPPCSFPPGYRFAPLDRELIQHYLANRVHDRPLPPNEFHVINLYLFNPATLAEIYKPCRENEWYFFTPRSRKYKRGKRPTRTAKDGFWKATGADTKIKSEEGVVIGFKKTLAFYLGQATKRDKTKTEWLMHEFTLSRPPVVQWNANDMTLDHWVLCKIYRKNAKTVHQESEEVEESHSDDHQVSSQSSKDMVLEDGLPSELIYQFGNVKLGDDFLYLENGIMDDFGSMDIENAFMEESALQQDDGSLSYLD